MLVFVIDKILVLFGGRRVFNRLLVIQWYSMTSLYILNHGPSQFFGGPVLLIILAFCIVLCVPFICLRTVFYVPYVANVSGLSIHDCPLGFP